MATSDYSTTTATTTTTTSSLPEVPNARSMIAGTPEHVPLTIPTEIQKKLNELAKTLKILGKTAEHQAIAEMTLAAINGSKGINTVCSACTNYLTTHKRPIFFGKEVYEIIIQIYNLSIEVYGDEHPSSSSIIGAKTKILTFDGEEFVDPSPLDPADFSRGLLEDEITPENTFLPDNGYIVKRKIILRVNTSETFEDKRSYSTDRYKKQKLLSIAINIYKILPKREKTNTDYDTVLRTLPYKDDDKNVIRHYLELFNGYSTFGSQPEDWSKKYHALGPEKDKDKLFWRMPCLEDILQGKTTRDCYLLGSLQAIVNKDPTVILRMMRDNGNGTVTVRLFDEQGHSHCYIIEKNLCHGFAKNCMWVQMVERAYLIHRRYFPSDHEKMRSFEDKREDLRTGVSEDAFSSILGTPENKLKIMVSQTGIKISLDENNGLATIGAFKESTLWPCEKGHCYAILGYINNPSTGFYILVTEPNRGSGGKYPKVSGVNYDPLATSLEEPEKCKGMERMWLRVNDFATDEELKYIIDVFDADGSPFKYLEEKGKQYHEEQQKRKAVE